MEEGNWNPFLLERWFARFEFSSQYLFCCSDCESISVGDLIQLDPNPTTTLEGLLSQSLGYTESQGNPVLREEISKLYGDAIQKDNILVAAGAEECIYLFFTTLFKKGDSVVVHYPCYQSLSEVATAAGCNVIQWHTSADNGWALDMKFLRKVLAEHNSPENTTNRIKGIVINCPHNPTGYTLSPAKLKKLVRIARRYGVYLFSDEVYRLLEWDEGANPLLPSACEIYEKAISIGVMSKSFGLAGLRIGWVASQAPEVLKAIATGKDYTTICSAAPSEYLSIVALRNKDKLLERNKKIARDNMALLDEFFENHKDIIEWVRPKAGPVGFPKLKLENFWKKETTEEGETPLEAYSKELVGKSGVLLLPGSCYGPEFKDHFRLGFGRKNLPIVLEKFQEQLPKNK